MPKVYVARVPDNSGKLVKTGKKKDKEKQEKGKKKKKRKSKEKMVEKTRRGVI